jgi:hypothetical protein
VTGWQLLRLALPSHSVLACTICCPCWFAAVCCSECLPIVNPLTARTIDLTAQHVLVAKHGSANQRGTRSKGSVDSLQLIPSQPGPGRQA